MTNSYLISVSYGKGCYRHIRISASATLYQLHEAIVAAFDFDDDHAHIFFMNNHFWHPCDSYTSLKLDDDDQLTSDFTLKELGLSKGRQFKYIFDFGQEHRFQCRVLQELQEHTDDPIVTRQVGESPEQYPDWGDEDEDDEDDDKMPFGDKDDDYPPLPEVYTEETIMQLLDELPLDDKVVGQLYTYFLAAARLYGIIPLGELLKIYNSQNDPVTEADFLAFAEIFYHADAIFIILGEEHLYLDAPAVPPIQRELIDLPLVSISFEMYYALKNGQQGKPYAVLPRKEFLRYADPDWHPQTAQSEALERYLQKKPLPMGTTAKTLVAELHFMGALDMPMSIYLDFLAKHGVNGRDLADTQELLTLLQELSNHTRKQINRGYTPAELFAYYHQHTT